MPLPQPLAVLLLVVPARAAGCDPTATSIAGKWKDPRHPVDWTVAEDIKRHTFTAHGPWPGTPHGELYANGSLTLVYSPTNTATGQFSRALGHS